jgi:hypothetical protein
LTQKSGLTIWPVHFFCVTLHPLPRKNFLGAREDGLHLASEPLTMQHQTQTLASPNWHLELPHEKENFAGIPLP